MRTTLKSSSSGDGEKELCGLGGEAGIPGSPAKLT
jgi:hypothetical protein